MLYLAEALFPSRAETLVERELVEKSRSPQVNHPLVRRESFQYLLVMPIMEKVDLLL